VLVDAAYGEPQIREEVAHPLGVTLGQVRVDGHQVRAAPRERVEVERHGGHEGLPLTGRHLRDIPLVEGDGADQLHVVRHHVPDRLLAGELDLGADQPAARLLDGGEGLGEDLVQDLVA